MSSLTLAHRGDSSFVNDNSVDLVLTDPPFNISKKTNFHTYDKNAIHSYQFDKNSDNSWDTYSHADFLVKLDEWAKEWSRILKKGGSFAIFCADAYISHLMEALTNNGLSPRRVISWRKNNSVPVNRKHTPMSAVEYIVTGVKKGKTSTFNADIAISNQTVDERLIESTIVADKVATILYNRIKNGLTEQGNLTHSNHIDNTVAEVEKLINDSIDDVKQKVRNIYKTNKEGEQYFQACIPNTIQHPLKVGNRMHPTEKPVPLLEYFIALYSKRGDTVFDGFAGSGSTGEAALSLIR